MLHPVHCTCTCTIYMTAHVHLTDVMSWARVLIFWCKLFYCNVPNYMYMYTVYC